jgi:hypothetical protein
MSLDHQDFKTRKDRMEWRNRQDRIEFALAFTTTMFVMAIIIGITEIIVRIAL